VTLTGAPRFVAACGTLLALSLAVATPAMAAPGDLDPSFDGDGVARTLLPGGSGTAESVLALADGTIVVAATQVGPRQGVAVVRYLANGAPDPAFSSDGIATSSLRGVVTGLARARGGGVVVSVWSNTQDGLRSRFGLVRFNADGSLDRRFGHGGRVTTTFGRASAIPWDVATAGRGRLVVAGELTNASGNVQDVALARYLDDGRLDRRFGHDGLVRTHVKGAYATGWSVTVGRGGGIVVAGDARASNGRQEHGLLARYRSDGRRSDHFSRDGVRLLTPAQAERFNDVRFLDSGKILAAGDARDDSVVTRVDGHGALDRGFGRKGLARTRDPVLRATFGVAVAPNGAVVTAGDGVDDTSGKPRSVVALVRYRRNGVRDASFGAGGIVVSALGGAARGGRSVAVQSDGRIDVAVESQRPSKTFRVLTARYLG
jgi:uncharacterized delta-60 repeat protein